MVGLQHVWLSKKKKKKSKVGERIYILDIVPPKEDECVCINTKGK